jgi:hypothetical protein
MLLQIHVEPYFHFRNCIGVIIYMMNTQLTPTVPAFIVLHAETETLFSMGSDKLVDQYSLVTVQEALHRQMELIPCRLQPSAKPVPKPDWIQLTDDFWGSDSAVA